MKNWERLKLHKQDASLRGAKMTYFLYIFLEGREHLADNFVQCGDATVLGQICLPCQTHSSCEGYSFYVCYKEEQEW